MGRLRLPASWSARLIAPRFNVLVLPPPVRAQLVSDWWRTHLRAPRIWLILAAWLAVFLLPAVLLLGFFWQLPHKPLAVAAIVLLLAAGQLLLHVGVIVPHKRFIVRRLTELGFCPRCGYDVRATPQRCPECGTMAVEVTDPKHADITNPKHEA